MTQPSPPVPQPSPEAPPPRLSARERARRRRRLARLLFWLGAIGALVLAVMLVRCGGGFGFGDGKGLGGGKGKGPSSGSAGQAAGALAPARCQLRVDAAGVSLAGKPTTIAAAVTACGATTGADVLITDARQGTWDELRAALDAAGIPSLVRGAAAPSPPVDARP
jgi:hypothetical protein